ncbi:hypothetical protein ABW19_dt0205517 [Dactylella cylindrospora]|nr:hypothetical protein ABW19_dt0205517 [Dactylella cylindrospora]
MAKAKVEATKQAEEEKSKLSADEIKRKIRSLAVRIKWTPSIRGRIKRVALDKEIETKYPQEAQSTCFICFEVLFLYEFVDLPCKHRHCHDCLRQNLQTVIKDPKLYPPKCCEPLDLAATTFVLPEEDLNNLLDVKRRHESTKIATCAFCQSELVNMSTEMTESAAYCGKCDKLTCVVCQKPMHKDICPEEEGAQELIESAKKWNWASCPKCSSIVSKNGGCNDIHCRCGATWCYLCRGVIGGLGECCNCAQGTKSDDKIKVGEAIPTDGNSKSHRTLLAKYRTGTRVKQRRVEKEKVALALAQAKKQKELEIVGQIKELRGTLDKILMPSVAVAASKARKKSASSKTPTATRSKAKALKKSNRDQKDEKKKVTDDTMVDKKPPSKAKKAAKSKELDAKGSVKLLVAPAQARTRGKAQSRGSKHAQLDDKGKSKAVSAKSA